ncbi:MAG: 30S ribosomal protein S2 [Candidatus Micrarchaeota archaeon]|nr:30S ribosomal protein S2 [Candidatus Micrarchaeota archaeon]
METYIEAGAHIGSKIKTGEAKKFIEKRRKDGIYIINIEKIDEGIQRLLKHLTKYDPKDIAIVATRYYAMVALRNFKKLFPDIIAIEKRFVPGSFTNPESKYFVEPEIVLSCDPNSEQQAVREANKMKIPIVGLVDTDTKTDGLMDYAPINNRGKRSLALFFWLLAREFYMKQGKIKSYSEFKIPISFFEKTEDEE